MKTHVLSLFGSFLFLTSFAQTTLESFKGCPSISVAVVREGDNSSTTNPFSIYKLNTHNGNQTLVSGPILDPGNSSANLQINGVGLNTADGYLYGLYAGIPTIPLALPIVPVFPFYRIGSDAVAEQLGTVSGPATINTENASIVNPAGGEIDRFGSYYFTAATGIGVPNFGNPSASTFTITRLFVGKIASVSGLAAGTSALSTTYMQITNPSGDASAFLSSLTTPSTIAGFQNTGLRDLVYNEFDNNLYTYVSFPIAGVFYGQMLKLNPATGILSAVAAPVVLSFAFASNEVAGTSMDVSGNLIILFTNGDLYKANRKQPGVFDGSLTLLEDNTGFPSPLRGDLASCGAGPEGGPLPVVLSNFSAYKQNTGVVVNWRTASEINVNKFILETSVDARNWTTFSEIVAQSSANGNTYQQVDNRGLVNTIYYRLAIIDEDGTVRYSGVKKISLNDLSFDFNVYPNPAKDNVTIESGQVFTPKSNIMLIDGMGRSYRLFSKKIAENMLSVNLSSFNKGVYFIHITTENGIIATKRITKL